MALNQPATWLIAYDISDPKRLARVHRYVRDHAIPLQYSVFLTEQTPRQIKKLTDELRTLIVEREDDVRVYRLPAYPTIETFGRTILPDGADLIDSALSYWLRDER